MDGNMKIYTFAQYRYYCILFPLTGTKKRKQSDLFWKRLLRSLSPQRLTPTPLLDALMKMR